MTIRTLPDTAITVIAYVIAILVVAVLLSFLLVVIATFG